MATEPPRVRTAPVPIAPCRLFIIPRDGRGHFGSKRAARHPPAPPVASAADVTGTWKSDFESQTGHQYYTFTFKQDGAKLTGKAHSKFDDREREAELKESKMEGDTISFVELFSFMGNEIRISYTGKLSADGKEIKFAREVGDFAREEIVAKRVQSAPSAS